MTPHDRDRAARILRRPGMPAAGDHARLLLRIADRPPVTVTRRSTPPHDDGPTLGDWFAAAAAALLVILGILGFTLFP